MNERRWCRQVAWLGTANLWEMGDLAPLPTPGTGEGCWEWRFTWDQVQPVHAERLARFCDLYHRE